MLTALEKSCQGPCRFFSPREEGSIGVHYQVKGSGSRNFWVGSDFDIVVNTFHEPFVNVVKAVHGPFRARYNIEARATGSFAPGYSVKLQ